MFTAWAAASPNAQALPDLFIHNPRSLTPLGVRIAPEKKLAENYWYEDEGRKKFNEVWLEFNVAKDVNGGRERSGACFSRKPISRVK